MICNQKCSENILLCTLALASVVVSFLLFSNVWYKMLTNRVQSSRSQVQIDLAQTIKATNFSSR